MPRGKEHNLSEAIRKALDVFGADSDREKTQKIKQWIKQQYPSLSRKVEDKNFGPSLSTQRKKMIEAGGGAAGQKAETTPAAPTAPASDGKTVAPPSQGAPAKSAAAVDVAAVVEAVKDLQALGSRVGGKENLRRLLDLLP
jgi:hypothetical protein